MSLMHTQIFDFKGGVHPAENKQQSTELPIACAPMPSKLVLPIAQHIGAPAEPTVTLGQQVLKGQVIAEAQGFVSANLHAPTSGTVSAIELRAIPHQSGMSDWCIEITPDGQDQWIEHAGIVDFLDVEPSVLLERIQQSGISGLGGAGFPSHVKLAADPAKIDTLIINAAECEPYITADDVLMRERAAEIIQGIEILLRIVNPKQCLIGIEDNKPEAIEALTKAIQVSRDDTHLIKLAVVPTKYPSGGEKQLINLLTGQEVPVGGIPADIGIVCQNVGTAYAIYHAVAKGEPLISRITTVTGAACAQPRNYEVLLGTPVSELLPLAGVDHNQMNRLIMGGPMMGFTLNNEEVPVVKTTNCLIAASRNELPDPAAEQACIRCGMCVEACPAQLLPQQLYWYAKSDNLEQLETHNLMDCIECGACAFVCPSNIPLVQYYRYGKGELNQARADKQKSDRAKERFEARLARQEREAAEKEAKRKARAEAAAKKQAEKKAAPATATGTSADAAQANAAQPDMALLQKKLDAAKLAIEKSKEKLAAAEAEGSDKVEAFKLAVEKSTQKMKDAAKAIAEAKKAAKAAPAANGASDKGDPNSPERLKNKLELAEARLKAAQDRLAEAEQQGSDKVDALKTAVEKQQERVSEAKAAYEQASSSASNSASTPASRVEPEPVSDLAAFEQKVLAAQTRVDKAQERLAMAQEQNLDTVAALQTGLEKQLAKLAEAKAALEQAQAGAQEVKS